MLRLLLTIPRNTDFHRQMTEPPSPPVRDAGRTTWWVAFAIVAAVFLAPLAVTEIPPLLDYPNHLARMEILVHGADDPALSRMYQAEWRVLPNIAIDVLMPAVMKFLPLTVAGKVFLGLSLLLPLAGVVALHRALFRVRSYWPLAAGLIVYNRLFFAGFMNFLIGVGLALLAAAFWETQRERRALTRVSIATVIALTLFFCHLIALAFYGLLLASLELAHAARWKRLEIGRLLLLAVPFVVPAVLYLNAPIAAAGSDGGHSLLDLLKNYYWAATADLGNLKGYGLMGPFLTYNRWLDAAALILTVGVVVVARARGWLLQAPAAAGLFAVLLIAYPFVPFFIFGTGWIDQRVPVLAGFLLFAGTLPVVPAGRPAKLAFAIFAALLLARTVEVSQVWAGRDAQLADFRHVIAPVRPDDRVLVVQAERNDLFGAMVNQPDSLRAMLLNDATQHLPALLVIERKAFWPLLFSAVTKQPVKVMPPYDAIALPEGELPWAGGLADPQPMDLVRAPYLPGWEQKFDWVLVLLPGLAAHGYDLLPDRLEPVAAGKVAALYRIRRPS